MADRTVDNIVDNEVPEVDYTAEDQPDDGKVQKEDKVQAKAQIQSQVQSDEGNRMLMSMISDPDIQAILAARRENRDVEVVSKDSVSKTPEKDLVEEDDLEGFDDEVKKIVKILDKKISSKIEPLVEKLSTLESLAKTFQGKDIDDQISSVKSKHPDFDKYRTEMAALARNEGAGLPVGELFLLAKHRAGDLKFVEESTHSERPTPTPRRKGVGVKKDQPLRGRRAFQVALADALDTALENVSR